MKRLVSAFGAVLLLGSTILAHEGATGIVKQRMDEMEQIGRVVKRINERLKSKRGLAEIARDAGEIHTAAGRVPSLFPQGSRDGHSDATPAVWERWSEFVAAARTLEGKLRSWPLPPVRTGTGHSGAVPIYDAACSGCHDVFRASGEIGPLALAKRTGLSVPSAARALPSPPPSRERTSPCSRFDRHYDTLASSVPSSARGCGAGRATGSTASATATGGGMMYGAGARPAAATDPMAATRSPSQRRHRADPMLPMIAMMGGGSGGGMGGMMGGSSPSQAPTQPPSGGSMPGCPE